LHDVFKTFSAGYEKTAFLFIFLPLIPMSGFSQIDSQRLTEVMPLMQALLTALVVHTDSILRFKAYGWRDFEHRIPDDTNSVFQIRSVTKQFTPTVILWLQEQEKLNIHDKLFKYFPHYRYADR
jgi:CubicO group peptidase (beta-lactamase class C family)